MKKTRKISYRDMLNPGAEKPAKVTPVPAPEAEPVETVASVETVAPVETIAPVEMPTHIEMSHPLEMASLLEAMAPEPVIAEEPPQPSTVAGNSLTLDAPSAFSGTGDDPNAVLLPEEEEVHRRAANPAQLREFARLREGHAELLLFRVGGEIFATSLAAIEEAVELPDIHHLPEQSSAMLGVFSLRGRLVSAYDPAPVLGVRLGDDAAAALLVRGRHKSIALAVDDVDDVMELDLSTLRDAPGVDDADGVLLGVARRGTDLIALLDADALVAACIVDRVLETA